MTFVVTERCIGTKEKTCVDVCPVDCIYDVGRMVVIHPDECIDCGACVPACPVEAIVADDELAVEDLRFAEINAAVAQGVAAVETALERVLGPPGGGTNSDRTGIDAR
jgi:ferredoxin